MFAAPFESFPLVCLLGVVVNEQATFVFQMLKSELPPAF